MNKDFVVLYIIAAIALCFGLVNGIQFLRMHNKTAQTVGTIISIKMPNPETARARNSKWAKVSYKVNGKNYQSKNRIQVPMASKVGWFITVRYDICDPERLYSFSVTRIIVSFLMAVICSLAAMFKLV